MNLMWVPCPSRTWRGDRCPGLSLLDFDFAWILQPGPEDRSTCPCGTTTAVYSMCPPSSAPRPGYTFVKVNLTQSWFRRLRVFLRSELPGSISGELSSCDYWPTPKTLSLSGTVMTKDTSSTNAYEKN